MKHPGGGCSAGMSVLGISALARSPRLFAAVFDQRDQACLIVGRLDLVAGGCDHRFRVAVTRSRRCLAPVGEIGIGIARAGPHRRGVDRHLEPLGQFALHRLAAGTDHDLGRNIAPIDDREVWHGAVFPRVGLAAEWAGAFAKLPCVPSLLAFAYEIGFGMTTAAMGYQSERTPNPAIACLGRGELAGLDGLRAISVLMVMFGHYGFGTILPGGLVVTLFFFLRAFLITTLMLREARTTGTISIGRFYLRRLLRLQPELWALIAITSVAGTFYTAWVWPRAIDLVAALLYVSNYLSVGVIGHDVTGELRWPHLWSLAVEEHYYLTYPLLFLSLYRTPKRLLAVLAVLLVATLAYRLVLRHLGAD
eukprot:gene23436-24887_t